MGAARGISKADEAVQGKPYMLASQLESTFGQPANKIMGKAKAVTDDVVWVGDQQAWPLSVVEARVRARQGALKLDVSKLPKSGSMFVELDAARHSPAGASMSKAEINASTWYVSVGGSKRLLRMVPAEVLSRPAPVADAAAGAVAIAGPAKRPVPRRGAPNVTPGASGSPGVASPKGPVAAAEQATTGAERTDGFSRQKAAALAGLGGLVTLGVAFTPLNQPNDSGATDPTSEDSGSSTEPGVTPAPEASATPTSKPEPPASAPPIAAPLPAPPPTAVEIAAKQRAELGANIAVIASTEVDRKVVATFDPRGNLTGEVAKYFATSKHSKLTDDYDWPGYFAAWVRQEGGDPITPGTEWKSIRDLMKHAESKGELKPKDHQAEPGDVVFFRTPATGDESGDNAGVVVARNGDQLTVARGWVKDGDLEKVAAVPLDRTSDDILGYAIVSPQD